MFTITIYRLAQGQRVDLAGVRSARDAAEMEEVVNGLHQEFPRPSFEVESDDRASLTFVPGSGRPPCA